VFLGRLDFEPNIQGLEWFCQRIWPRFGRRSPMRGSRSSGSPMAEVSALARLPGVELIADLPDLRAEVQRRSIVVLPFVSGGGIKNKLLEAAAMALPIVCTPRTLNGLRSPSRQGLVSATSPGEWVAAMTRLWWNTEGAVGPVQRASGSSIMQLGGRRAVGSRAVDRAVQTRVAKQRSS
jgi:hypothetical protein